MKTIRLLALFVYLVLFFTSYANAQEIKTETIYHPKLPNEDLNIAKSHLTDLLYQEATPGLKNYPKKVLVFDDRFEMVYKKSSKIIKFSDILNPIVVTKRSQGSSYNKYISLVLKNNAYRDNLYVFDDNTLKDLADHLFYFQHKLNKIRYDSLANIFKPVATQYCALKVKPQILEEQRKYIVQANMFNQQKAYEKAVELYKKVIEIDQVAYPAAYSNLALLSAQVEDYDAAIYNMKLYLMLEPESVGVRSCQDKIYEWEAQISK